jgi:hypothetical protein
MVGTRGDIEEPRSHLFKEFIHEAVSVHSDSDIVVVIAVLGLDRVEHM